MLKFARLASNVTSRLLASLYSRPNPIAFVVLAMIMLSVPASVAIFMSDRADAVKLSLIALAYVVCTYWIKSRLYRRNLAHQRQPMN